MTAVLTAVHGTPLASPPEPTTRDDERVRWSREDAARSYERRRDAYVDFIVTVHQLGKTLAAWAAADDEYSDDDEPPYNYLDPLYDRLTLIQVFGSTAAAALAEEVLDTLSDVVFRGKSNPRTPELLRPLLREIRSDLSVPDSRETETNPTT